MWYAAHILLAERYIKEEQTTIPIWEQIPIIDAETDEEAFSEADRIGEFQAISEGHTYDGHPIRWIYEGVRRLAECIDFEEGPPVSGKEVAYLSYFVQDDTDLKKMRAKRSAP